MRLNRQIWAGFVLSLVAGLSYPFVFAQWAITREFPWVNLILFAIAFALLFLGLRRAFKPDKRLFSKIFSSLAAAFGVFMLAALLFLIFVMGSWLPPSAAAPQVGQKAPDFALTDANDKHLLLMYSCASHKETHNERSRSFRSTHRAQNLLDSWPQGHDRC